MSSLGAPIMLVTPNSSLATAAMHETSGKTKYSAYPGGIMVPSSPSSNASQGSRTSWYWNFITAIPSAIGYTVSGDTSAVVGGLSSAAHATASGLGTAYNDVTNTASNVASKAVDGLEGAAVSAAKQAGAGISAFDTKVESIGSAAGGAVMGVVNTAEGAVTALSWTPFLIVGVIIAAVVFFPQHTLKAGKVIAGGVA